MKTNKNFNLDQETIKILDYIKDEIGITYSRVIDYSVKLAYNDYVKRNIIERIENKNKTEIKQISKPEHKTEEEKELQQWRDEQAKKPNRWFPNE